MKTQDDLDRTLHVGDTALVVGSDPEVMVEITAVVGAQRVLGKVVYGPDLDTQHGYDRTELSKRFTFADVAQAFIKN